LVLCFLVGNVFMKNFFMRPRPCWIDSSVNLLISIPTDFSFPSGHSMCSFAAATVLYSMNKKIGIASLILAFLIAFSRLYLFVHYPSDVLVGSIIGILLGIISVKILNKIYNKRFRS
ncbi:MAG: phosphatase PAP2 family protein, partial [Clostridium sp.]